MVCVFGFFFLFSLNSPHSCYEIKQDVFCSGSYIFISLSQLWAVCHVVSCRGNVQCSSRALVCDVLCDGCGRSFSVLACESGLLFKIHVWFLGLVALGVLGLVGVSPWEQPDPIWNHRHFWHTSTCNDTFGKNKEDDRKWRQKIFVCC